MNHPYAYLTSHQDFKTSMAGYAAVTYRVYAAFPEMEGNTRTVRNEVDQDFKAALHEAMGYRRDHNQEWLV